MAGMGSFGRDRRVACAVSGGGDSMAMAFLAAQWGQPVALIVDHGLRAGSAHEAGMTRERLTALGIEAHVLPKLDLMHGPALAQRARTARYESLTAVCKRMGLVDLLVAHHAQDQAETLLLRRQAGSGPAGLAGMAGIAFFDTVRMLRPLLSVMPARLRTTLRQAGVGWIDDPSNSDRATPRGRLRATSDMGHVADGCAEAARQGAARQTEELAVAAELGRHASILPTGVAVVTADRLRPAALSSLVWTVSGARHPPATASVIHLSERLRPATLHGAAIVSSPSGWLIGREAQAQRPAIAAAAGAHWDGRWRLATDPPPGLTIGALGEDASRLRRLSSLPAALLRTLPALRCNDRLFAVPHLAYPDPQTCSAVPIAFEPSRPVAPAPFMVA